MNQFPTYSVAIRTLGQSGEKFRRTIESLLSQTVRPSGIYVYIAEGYALPGRVADEVYITCPKGMVAQRALPFTEIETELVLLSDDDIEFASDSVERLMSGLLEMGGDCISANVFPNHKWNFKQKFVQAAFHGILPSLFGKYAFRIRKDASYSYALFPKRIMRSQSCAGAALLIYKTVLSNLHYSEECWMDHFSMPLEMINCSGTNCIVSTTDYSFTMIRAFCTWMRQPVKSRTQLRPISIIGC